MVLFQIQIMHWNKLLIGDYRLTYKGQVIKAIIHTEQKNFTNNLHELWALLNSLLPDILCSLDQFDERFNLEIDDFNAKKDEFPIA